MSLELGIVGVSHHTAPVSVRESLAVPADAQPNTLRAWLAQHRLSEGVLISTCNRVELVVAGEPGAVAAARECFTQRAPQQEGLHRHLYTRMGADAVRHLFRVAAGLDSMVLGEPQILGQVKDAVETATSAGTLGPLLGRCFDHAFNTAKRVRSETSLASGHVSVSSVACELAQQIFGELVQHNVMLVGAGKMSEMAARSLANRGARLFVVNRSEERARSLAEACGGTPRRLESLAEELVEADVVIASTANPHFVITHTLMQDVVKARRRRPIFLIDIAVPRDIDPRVAMLDNVFLYDIDDLQRVSQENLATRRSAADTAEQIVGVEVTRFETWRRSLQLTPTIVALRQRFQKVARQELEQTLPRLSQLEDRDRQALERMCDALVNKLLHTPLTELKRGAAENGEAQLIEAARRLFQLEALEAEAQRTQVERTQAERDQGERSQVARTSTEHEHSARKPSLAERAEGLSDIDPLTAEGALRPATGRSGSGH